MTFVKFGKNIIFAELYRENITDTVNDPLTSVDKQQYDNVDSVDWFPVFNWVRGK